MEEEKKLKAKRIAHKITEDTDESMINFDEDKKTPKVKLVDLQQYKDSKNTRNEVITVKHSLKPIFTL